MSTEKKFSKADVLQKLQTTDVPTIATIKPLRFVAGITWDTAVSSTFSSDIRCPFNPDYMVLRQVTPQLGALPCAFWSVRCIRLIPGAGIITSFSDGGGVMPVTFTPQTEYQMYGAVNDNFTFELLDSTLQRATSHGFLFMQLEFYKL